MWLSFRGLRVPVSVRSGSLIELGRVKGVLRVRCYRREGGAYCVRGVSGRGCISLQANRLYRFGRERGHSRDLRRLGHSLGRNESVVGTGYAGVGGYHFLAIACERQSGCSVRPVPVASAGELCGSLSCFCGGLG